MPSIHLKHLVSSRYVTSIMRTGSFENCSSTCSTFGHHHKTPYFEILIHVTFTKFAERRGLQKPSSVLLNTDCMTLTFIGMVLVLSNFLPRSDLATFNGLPSALRFWTESYNRLAHAFVGYSSPWTSSYDVSCFLVTPCNNVTTVM